MASTRYVPGLTQTRSGAIERSEIEPNRNFPLAGESYAQARARGAAGPRAPELAYRDPATGVLRTPASRSDRPVDVNSVRMIAETRILLSLIERFQPERLATVHAHSLSHRPGDAPGIFVDPRGVDPYTGVPRTDLLSESQRMADDELTERMVTSGRTRLAATPLPLTTGRRPRAPFDPFMGNVAGGGWTVHYAPSADHPEGTSLGMYAPEPVPGVREGITTITIEVPQYAGSSAGALPAIEDLDRDLLADIFLEDPTTVSTIYPTR
jgi:hypothetical protein